MDSGVQTEDGLGPGSTRMSTTIVFTPRQLAILWESATDLPAEDLDPLTNAILGEAIEGSDEGEYPLILDVLARIITDIEQLSIEIESAVRHRYHPCRIGDHEDCVGKLDEPATAIPPFCTCPCHGGEKEG